MQKSALLLVALLISGAVHSAFALAAATRMKAPIDRQGSSAA